MDNYKKIIINIFLILSILFLIYFAIVWFSSDDSGEAGFAILAGVFIPILLYFKKKLKEKNTNEKISLSNNPFINKIKNIFAKKVTIELDENNQIINIKDFEITIKTMINYRLHNKNYFLKVNSKKWKEKYQKVKEKKDLQLINQFKEFLLHNKEYTDFCTNVINLVIKDVTTRKLLLMDYIPNIAEGIINHMRYESYKNHMKIDLFTITQDFGCSIYLNKQEIEILKKNIPFSIKHLTAISGYDIFNLPYDVQYKKAIPAIICTLYERDKNLDNLEKYLSLKIGLG